MVKDDMGTKNKGGREVRKPKQAKKPKAPAPTTVVPPGRVTR